jgi:hypothetical protein
MALLSDIYPYVLPELPGCPTPMVDRATIDATRELCRRSGILTKRDEITVVPGVKEYTITPPLNTEVLSIRRVTLGTSYVPIYQHNSNIIEIDYDESGASIVYYEWKPQQNKILLYPTPTVVPNEKLRVEYVYQPQKNSTDIPDVIMDRWPEALANKIKSILMRQSGKEWSNPSFALANEREWWRLLADIRSEANLMFNNQPQVAVYSLDKG